MENCFPLSFCNFLFLAFLFYLFVFPSCDHSMVVPPQSRTTRKCSCWRRGWRTWSKTRLSTHAEISVQNMKNHSQFKNYSNFARQNLQTNLVHVPKTNAPLYLCLFIYTTVNACGEFLIEIRGRSLVCTLANQIHWS